MDGSFEPRIVVFACNWCSYAAMDLAGTSRMKYPPNLSVIKLMCSGRLDPQFILEAFRRGADGILVTGCRPGDCHYIEGNFKALRRMVLLRRMLENLGVDKQRLRLEWISASEPGKFVKIANEMVQQLRPLGPLMPKMEVNV